MFTEQVKKTLDNASKALEAYIQTKDTSRDHDKVKKAFFTALRNQIEQDKLTILSLTVALRSYNLKQHQELFYKSHGSPAKSQAAKWVIKLYRALGVKINERFVLQLIEKGMTPEVEQTFIPNHYQRWLKKPYSEKRTAILRREIEAGAKDMGFPAFLGYVAEVAPDYFAYFVNERFQTAQDKNSFIGQLKHFCDQRSTCIPWAMRANTQLADALSKKDPQYFFYAPLSVRQALLDLNQENSNWVKTLMPVGKEFYEKFSQERILQRFKQNFNQDLLVQDQKARARQAILAYVKRNPNAFKQAFFQNLLTAIEQHNDVNSFDLRHLLDQHLQATNLPKLFSRWFWQPRSRASHLVADLFHIASGQTLSETDLQVMISQPGPYFQNSPLVALENLQQQMVDDAFKRPELLSGLSPLSQELIASVQAYKAASWFRSESDIRSVAQAEAIYQSYLIRKGLTSSQKQPIFDTQGNVLVQVELAEEDWKALTAELTESGYAEQAVRKLIQELKNTHTQPIEGRLETRTTWCNLDIGRHDKLREAWISTVIGKNESLKQPLEALLQSGEINSLIGLQEEMAMHVSLLLRVFKTHLPLKQGLSAENWQKLMQKINEEVFRVFRQALNSSLQKGAFNIAKINRCLDKERPELTQNCETWLMEIVSSEITDAQNWKRFLMLVNKEEVTSTTATGSDYLKTSADMQSVLFISATDKTAHAKKEGADEQALRFLSRHHYNCKAYSLSSNTQVTQEARVPSIAQKRGKHATAVRDVADKLQAAYLKLHNKKTGPITYNLLTSLRPPVHSWLFDGANHQRASAARILKGSHLYNKERLLAGESEAMIFVQNIPVNQHTNRLSFTSADDATAEATLMAEMSFLRLFEYHGPAFSTQQRLEIEQVNRRIQQAYHVFLERAGDGKHYFKDSPEGKKVIEQLSAIKSAWQGKLNELQDNKQDHLLIKVLFKLFVTHEYRKRRYGAMVPSLSVLSQPVSISGCKSANERYQMVAGRVGFLKMAAEAGHSAIKAAYVEITTAMQDYLADSAVVSAEPIQEKIDIAYNRFYLYAGESSVCKEDVGASYKIQASGKKKQPNQVNKLNTNVAETGYVDRLFQKHVSQSHKINWNKVLSKLAEDSSSSSAVGSPLIGRIN